MAAPARRSRPAAGRARPAPGRESSRRPASESVVFGQVQVSSMQRSRLLAAAVGVVGEFGWEGASVARITDRAGVSRRTFYELFESRDECLLGLLESTVAQITAELDATGLKDLPWREYVRGGLWVILCFFDREPALANVCLVESRRGGGVALEYRQRVIDGLVEIVDRGRGEDPRSNDVVDLTAHGVVGGALEVLYSRLLKAPQESLRELHGQLTGMTVLPYLGVAASQREQRRPAPTVAFCERSSDGQVSTEASDVLAALPMRMTYRTANVLQALAERPGQSNREVADLVGISDQGQISKLLSRLARLGLLSNAGVAGERNRWELTATGSRVTRSIKSYAQQETGHVIKGDAQHV